MSCQLASHGICPADAMRSATAQNMAGSNGKRLALPAFIFY